MNWKSILGLGPKEPVVADEVKQAPAGLSKDDVQSMINKSIEPITLSQRQTETTLGEISTSLKAMTPEPKKEDAAKPLTAEAVSKLVTDAMAAGNKASESKAHRDAYLGDKLKDLPAAYKAQLGTDPAKWASEEQAIREAYKADLKSAGVEPKNVGHAAADGGDPPAKVAVDRTKMSPLDLIKSEEKTA